MFFLLSGKYGPDYLYRRYMLNITEYMLIPTDTLQDREHPNRVNGLDQCFNANSSPQKQHGFDFTVWIPWNLGKGKLVNWDRASAARSLNILRNQEGLHHFFSGLGAGVDIFKSIGHWILSISQAVPVRQNIVIFKHFLIISNGVVKFNETSVIIF